MSANFMLLSDRKNPLQMKPLLAGNCQNFVCLLWILISGKELLDDKARITFIFWKTDADMV